MGLELLLKNQTILSMLKTISSLERDNIPIYFGAGVVVQGVWNVMTSRDDLHGIKDIDLVYYDNRDLSYDAEDIVIQYIKSNTDFPLELDIKNVARIHLWYPDKWNMSILPYTSVEDAVRTYPFLASSVVARWDGHQLHAIAPYGVSDVDEMIVRRNPHCYARESYCHKKALQWKSRWPELNIM